MDIDKFRAAIDSSPMGASVYSMTRKQRVFSNRKAIELFGAASEAEFNAFPAADTFFDPEQAAVLDAAPESSVPAPREEIRRRLDGSLFICKSTRHRLTIGDDDVYLIWFEDITEREATAERFRRVFNIPTIPMALYYAEDKSWIEYNDAFRDLFGYDDDTLAGMTWIDLTHPEDLQLNLNAFDQATVEKATTAYTLLKRFIHKNGDVIHARIHAEHIRGIDDKPDYAVLVVHDITADVEREKLLEQRQEELLRTVTGLEETQEELLKSTKKLELMAASESRLRELADAANTSKSQFLATVSHEVRTPMTGIMGFADMLLDEDLPEAARDMVARIKLSTTSLLTVINDVLDISKLDAGKLEIEHVNFNPVRVAHDVLDTVSRSRLPGKRGEVAMDVEIADGFPEAVSADPTRLRQILLNLIGNAVKFTEEGTVSVRCRPGDVPSTMRFEIEDTGIGIEPSTQSKLFADFVQADSSISRKYQGTGLGLSICRRLVDLMGGVIGVKSVPGKGSTFWFTLPYAPVPEGAALVEETVLVSRTYKAAKQLSVLVAEDNEVNQEIIGNMLQKMGHRHMIAANGMEAVDAVRAADFDLVLMDVRMPELSGPDATRQIRALADGKRAIPIIALTADAMVENRQSYFDAGMDGFVAKPINSDQLAAAINNVLGTIVNMPVEAKSTEAGGGAFDLDELQARLGLPLDLLVPILEKFSEDYADVCTDLAALLDDQDPAPALEVAHDYKGIAGSLGLTAVHAAAAAMEAALIDGNRAAAKAALQALVVATATAIDGIENHESVAEQRFRRMNC
ncbi:MAG: response regulator [Rhodospirillales bacterium]|nr:response regulator [Rhodospirillales bacterium]MBO6785230.1 response regulator [Rhodospirillales bacterium]